MKSTNFRQACSDNVLHRRLMVLGLVIIAFSFYAMPPVVTAISSSTGQVKVMTYNVLHNNEKDANFHRAKMDTLAQYLKAQQIDIVGLQEMKLGINDGQYLREGLQAVGYSMPYVADGQDISGDFRNVLFSRYPITNYKEIPINASRSILDMDIDIPNLGIHHFIVIHIYGGGNGGEGSSCQRGFMPYIIPHLTNVVATTKNIVLLGDFNMELNRWCDTNKLKGQFDVSCFNSENNPLCGHLRMIDYIAVHNDSTFALKNEYVDGSIAISDHRPVIATLVAKNPPAPSTIPGDFDHDGKVNLSDLQTFLAKLHTNVLGFSLVGNDSFVDLYDYNHLLTLLEDDSEAK